MGLLNKTRVYLIGAMERAVDGRGWRERITPDLQDMGITVFDPYRKPFRDDTTEDEAARAELKQWMENEEYDRVTERMKRVRNFDLRLCDISDFIIAHINPSVASWGTAEELTTNVRSRKPIFISVDGGKAKTPLWVMAMVPHKYIYNSVDEIMEMIKKIDKEENVIDSDRWKLLLPQYR